MLCLLSLALLLPVVHGDPDLPPGFRTEEIGHDWHQPMDLAYLPDGRLLVIEKEGLVHMVENDVVLPTPVLDLSQEVGSTVSHGFKSLAVDPDFANNGRIYLLYEVDRHYLLHYGTSNYDPTLTDLVGSTIARVTRYELDAADSFHSVVPGSRYVLVGDALTNGIPVIEDNHSSGCLRFGLDGSLLVSCGDGAGSLDSGDSLLALQAILQGILPAGQNVGAFRAQLPNSLAGKLLRLDPETGYGLPTNPFFDAATPDANHSKVWSYGLRNPFRFGVMPFLNRPDNHPGWIVIGDVGLGSREEVNISLNGGENFGWPLFEGLESLSVFRNGTENVLAPNPAFGQPIPGGGFCTRPYFSFEELLIQATGGTPSWPNACNPSLEVPASFAPSMHRRPLFEWGHTGPVRGGAFDAQNNAISVEIGEPGGPIQGFAFDGSCVIGGVFATSASYPANHRFQYYFADFTGGWIRSFGFSGTPDSPVLVMGFAEDLDQVVALTTSPAGELVYAQLSGSIHRVIFDPGNAPPTARPLRTPHFGPAGVKVQFDASLSSDPEGGELEVLWHFGDGTPTSDIARPMHVFPSQDITSSGTIVSDALSFVPPQPPATVAGFNPEVIRDGVYPNGSTGSLYPIYSTDAFMTSDPTALDWIGYTFSQVRRIHGLVYQEGFEESVGGWFQDVGVQVRVGGQWVGVSNIAASPEWIPNNGTPFETYRVFFDPVDADGVRMIGLPGGTDGFIMVSELRVLAEPIGLTPSSYDVTLAVFDDTNLVDVERRTVWIDETPPVIDVISPVNGGTYDPNSLVTIQLDAMVTDAESPSSSIVCEWQAFLHHNDHVHPQPVIPSCTGSTQLTPHGALATDVFSWRFEVTARDPSGLVSKETIILHPEQPSLIVDHHEVSVSDGGTTTFSLDAGPANAGKFFLVLPSASGIWPGSSIGGMHVPINVDALTLQPFLEPSGFYSEFLGFLDSNGEATVSFSLDPLFGSLFLGRRADYAFVTASSTSTVDFASNSVGIEFVE